MVIDITVLYFLLPIILEPFPVSSSGHALLFERIFKLFISVPILAELSGPISFALHLPIALLLPFFFFSTIKRVLMLLWHNKQVWWRYLSFGIAAESVTLVWFTSIRSLSINNSYQLLLHGFLITGVLLIGQQYLPIKRPVLHWSHGIIMGFAQGGALLPGISRLGATLFAARLCGFSPKKAFELSCLIEWPISLAAGCLGLYNLSHSQLPDLLRLQLQVAMVIGMPIAYAGYHFFYWLLKEQKLTWCAWYLICLGVLGYAA